VVVDALQLLTPQIVKSFTDSLLGEGFDPSGLWIYPVLVLLVALGVALSRYVWRILIILTSREMEYWLRNRLFTKLTTLSQTYYHHQKTGDLMAHATNDINAVRMAFGPGIIMAVDAVFLTIMTVVIMAVNLNLKLTLIALIPMPVITLVVLFFGKIIQHRFKEVQEAFSTLSDRVQESFTGIRVIKSFNQEEKDLAAFNEANFANLKSNMNLVRIYGFMHPFIGLISTISLLVILAFGGSLVIQGQLTLGEFVAFISYIQILTWPMMAIGFVVNVLQRGVTSIKRINTILDSESELFSRDEKVPENLDIEIRNLTFNYKDTPKPALKGLSVRIPEGGSLGILGPTGCGKTTFVSLLTRLFQVNPGEIFIGGHDILDYPIETVRDLIGVVPQDNFLFSTTIEENIAFSKGHADRDAVLVAAEKAQITDEIAGLPGGFATLLGEKGVNLSGGQKQRTAIARALYKDPRILILDDALSAVDTDTEERILNFFKDEMKGRTAIVVSHRISTLKTLDRIMVLDEGALVELGTHAELMALKGMYHRIYHKQLLEETLGIKGEVSHES